MRGVGEDDVYEGEEDCEFSIVVVDVWVEVPVCVCREHRLCRFSF